MERNPDEPITITMEDIYPHPHHKKKHFDFEGAPLMYPTPLPLISKIAFAMITGLLMIYVLMVIVSWFI
jgi:hypothetical protein